jgi:hypothetical protein
VVESEVYDMWGNTGCRIRRKGRMWMSLLTRRQLGRIGCCAVRGRIRGRSLVLRTSTLSGHRQSQESREPFAFGELVRISVVAVTQRVEYFVECEVKDTVADARDWGGVTLALELVQTAIRSRANSSMARLEENSSDGRTHSRSGSGLDAVRSSNGSSNGNNTFGHPPGTDLFEYD